MVTVNFYKMHPDVRTPKFGTDYANCFDLEYFPVGNIVHGYNEYNVSIERFVDMSTGSITINPGERLMVPTGLIFQFREHQEGKVLEDNAAREYSLRLHSRSGLALKRGLVLANGQGIVDIDYHLQVFALIANVSTMTQNIDKHERICQAEVVKNEKVFFNEFSVKPERLGNRNGGFGSTGTK